MLELSRLHTAIFFWWRQAGRVLPWREKVTPQISTQELSSDTENQLSLRDTAFTSYFASSLQRNPYKVIVAELMLQQTQVDRVLPKFEAWLKRWPSAADLAQASLAEVLIFWQGLGYNRRAKFLWKLAQRIEENKGIWPTTEKELLDLPGIGKYTARAVMSFALGQQVGVVDTNIKRVIARVRGIEWSEKQVDPAFDSKVDYFQLADEMLPVDQADPWNQAIMDLGAMVCTARSPKCDICPISQLCESNLKAVEHGWKNYGEWLKSVEQKKKESGVGVKKKRVRFEDTDRFFRGRIMDLLRESAYEMVDLEKKMEDDFGLVDKERFCKLVKALSEEQMVSVNRNKVSLG